MSPDLTRSDDQSVNPEMITLAREARGLTQAELARRTGVSQSLLSKIESGLVIASHTAVADLAVALDYPAGFFFSKEPVLGPSTSEFFHRKRAAARSRLIDKIHAQINIRRIHVARLLKATEVDVRIPHLDPDEFDGDVAEVARAVRAGWQVPKGPIKDIIKLLEDNGGIVIRMPFDTRLVDAVSWWVPKMPPLFFVNESIPADRERLSLAHELGHMVMHTVVRLEMEDEANRFAAEFLMPDADIRHQLRNVSLHSLASLKPYWRVSMQALLKRAQDTGAIPDKLAKKIWIQISSSGYRLREPAELDFPKESPTLLKELVELHCNQLSYDAAQMAKLLTLNERDISAQYGVNAGADVSKLRIVK